MPTYKVHTPVELNWRVYTKGAIVNYTPKEGETVVWGTLVQEGQFMPPAPKLDTLSALARREADFDASRLAQLTNGASTGVAPVAPQAPAPRPALSPPPEDPPPPATADVLS